MAHPDQVRGYVPLPLLIDRTVDSHHSRRLRQPLPADVSGLCPSINDNAMKKKKKYDVFRQQSSGDYFYHIPQAIENKGNTKTIEGDNAPQVH